MVKSIKEVTLKTPETYFLHKKSQKMFRKKFPKKFFHILSRIVPKKREVTGYRLNKKLGVSLKHGLS